MYISPIHPDILAYLRRHNLLKKFEKQLKFLQESYSHPSLHVKILNPRKLKIFSFRLDKKYRVIFSVQESTFIEILDITNHYE